MCVSVCEYLFIFMDIILYFKINQLKDCLAFVKEQKRNSWRSWIGLGKTETIYCASKLDDKKKRGVGTMAKVKHEAISTSWSEIVAVVNAMQRFHEHHFKVIVEGHKEEMASRNLSS